VKKININSLFAAARSETVPAVDVADSVLATLALSRQPVSMVLSRSLVWMSMASSAVAAGIVLAAVIAQWQNADSVNEIISIVAWVTQ
jgi:hypothetical protein